MKDIKGYEGLYAITSCGKVWSYRRKKFLSPADNGHGYLHVVLRKNGVNKHYRVHRLVAEAYIPNPENKSAVNHKDEIRNHNWVGNLEWATAKENINYSSPAGKPKTFSKVRCIETDTIYKNCADAERETNIHRYSINNVLNGK
jgi:hypothetical protein